MENNGNYIDKFLEFYQNGLIKIIWSANGFSIAVDAESKDKLQEFQDEKFIDTAFSVIKIVSKMANNKDIDFEDSGLSKKYIEVAKIILDSEPDLENHLAVKRLSINNNYRVMEYDIVAHRNRNKPDEIVVNAALLKFMCSDEEEKRFIFEVSRRDVNELINQLTELSEKLEEL